MPVSDCLTLTFLVRRTTGSPTPDGRFLDHYTKARASSCQLLFPHLHTMSHYAIFAWRAWGHCRPELVFATRLIRLHPHLRITIFLPEVCKELYEPMLAKCGLSVEQRTRLKAVEYPLKLEGWKRDRRFPTEDDETLWRYCNMVGSELLVHYEGWLEVRRYHGNPK